MTFVSTLDAVAFQISDTPSCVLARFTSVHVRPAPEIVSVCPPDVGPSDAAKAINTSFALDVLKAAVVRLPLPSE